MWTLGKFVSVLTVLFILVRFRFNLALSILATAVFMGLIYGSAPIQILTDVWYALTDLRTMWLVSVIASAMFLASFMSSTNLLRKMTSALSSLVRDLRFTVTGIPALIGLIPMPAGALVSAVMIDESSNEIGIKSWEKTFLNYWFRHLWEPIWPMYQSVILASSLFSIPLVQIAVINLPITLAAMATGILVATRLKSSARCFNGGKTYESWLILLKSIWPILLVIALDFIFKVDLLIAFLASVAATIAYVRPKIEHLKVSLRKALDPTLLGAVAAVMVFKRIVESTGSMDLLVNTMQEVGLSPMIPIALIPLIVALMTGISLAFVGIAFPLISPFIFQGGSLSVNMFRLAYGFGYVGMMLTPIHLCLSTTIEYYKADMGKVYRYLIPSSLVIALTVITLTFIHPKM